MLKACFAGGKKPACIFWINFSSDFSSLWNMLLSFIKHGVSLLTVPFDKKKSCCQFPCHEYLYMLVKCKKQNKTNKQTNETNPVLFTSGKFTECLDMLACRSAVPFLCINDKGILTANKYLHFSCDGPYSRCLFLNAWNICSRKFNKSVMVMQNE